jgi:hypothetical protein
MSSLITIEAAMTDPALLGAALGPIEPWAPWRAVLKAAYAEPLTPAERATFGKLAGGRKPPKRPVAELWAAAGRRSGKTRMASLASVYVAACVDHSRRLAPGEQGVVLLVAPSTSQATLAKGYAEAFLRRSPVLAPMIVGVTADEIELSNGVVIAIGAANFRTLRGRTLLGVVVDEVAFLRDETSATPDVELVRAVMPSLAAAGGMLIAISSPYRKVGVLAQRHRDHFGKNSDVLVIQAATTELNPTLDSKIIARAKADDPTAARSEWDAEFREDIASLLSDAMIDAAVETGRPLELPRVPGVTYRAFVDASAGRHDAFCVCIGHKHGDGFVADLVRGRKAPFNPRQVASEYATLARSYGCTKVRGDAYAGEWVAQAFRDAGVAYERARKVRSELYLEGVPHFTAGRVKIPDIPILVRELRLLERRTARSGKDAVDHPRGGSDDHANVLFGALHAVLGRREWEDENDTPCGPRVYARPRGGPETYDPELDSDLVKIAGGW